ncbi:MAG: MarR family winged helix-turn-helix transcriptional regulator, partial [Sphingomonadaceae bacterium]
DAQSADHAGALLGLNIVAFLPADCTADQLQAAIEAALHRGATGVADSMQQPFDPRIEELRRQTAQLMQELERLAAGAPAPGSRTVDAPRIRAHIKARRLRESFFDPGLFADPAWDILLDLAAARLEGRSVSVSSLCIAAAVPTTTALRWIKNMVDAGLLERHADREDARRAFIALAPATAVTLERCLDTCFNYPGL